MTVYVLRDDLKHLWKYRYRDAARRFLNEWSSRTMESEITPLKSFAEKLAEYLSHCQFHLHASLLEGINNKIKVIKRWPAASMTTNTSSSRSGTPHPEIEQEPERRPNGPVVSF